jgi:hypothetical protein
VREEGEFLGIKLANEDDVTVDATEVALHDTRHDEEMGRIKG